jgi:hypothetical protein
MKQRLLAQSFSQCEQVRHAELGQFLLSTTDIAHLARLTGIYHLCSILRRQRGE